MSKAKYSSPAIVRDMERIYGSKAKTVKIDQLPSEPVKKFVLKIEEGHKRAAKSKLIFR
ncbi:MAG: hypothetical protein ACYDHZ_01055 [Dehalococcoidia bacterium]